MGRPWAGPCIYSEAIKPDPGENTTCSTATVHRNQQQGQVRVPGEKAQLGLPSRLLFSLPFHADI